MYVVVCDEEHGGVSAATTTAQSALTYEWNNVTYVSPRKHSTLSTAGKYQTMTYHSAK